MSERENGDPAWPAPLQRNMDALADEMKRARTKFPDNRDLGMALLEEVFELFEEMVEQRDSPFSRERRRAEALQVACVAMRLYEEEDPIFSLHPTKNGQLIEMRDHMARAAISVGRTAKFLLEQHPLPKD